MINSFETLWQTFTEINPYIQEGMNNKNLIHEFKANPDKFIRNRNILFFFNNVGSILLPNEGKICGYSIIKNINISIYNWFNPDSTLKHDNTLVFSNGNFIINNSFSNKSTNYINNENYRVSNDNSLLTDKPNKNKDDDISSIYENPLYTLSRQLNYKFFHNLDKNSNFYPNYSINFLKEAKIIKSHASYGKSYEINDKIFYKNTMLELKTLRLANIILNHHDLYNLFYDSPFIGKKFDINIINNSISYNENNHIPNNSSLLITNHSKDNYGVPSNSSLLIINHNKNNYVSSSSNDYSFKSIDNVSLDNYNSSLKIDCDRDHFLRCTDSEKIIHDSWLVLIKKFKIPQYDDARNLFFYRDQFKERACNLLYSNHLVKLNDPSDINKVIFSLRLHVDIEKPHLSYLKQFYGKAFGLKDEFSRIFYSNSFFRILFEDKSSKKLCNNILLNYLENLEKNEINFKFNLFFIKRIHEENFFYLYNYINLFDNLKLEKGTKLEIGRSIARDETYVIRIAYKNQIVPAFLRYVNTQLNQNDPVNFKNFNILFENLEDLDYKKNLILFLEKEKPYKDLYNELFLLKLIKYLEMKSFYKL